MLYAIVNKPLAVLKKSDSCFSVTVDEAVYGMKLLVLGRKGEWCYVRTHYRYEGYVHNTDLLYDDEKVNKWNLCEKDFVVQSVADVLSEARYQSSVLISLPKTSQVSVLSKEKRDGFVHIVLPDQRKGYIRADFLNEDNMAGYFDYYHMLNAEMGIGVREYVNQYLKRTEDEFRASLVNTALTFMGIQYRWGGKTTLGVDCSGLCFSVYMLNGLIIYRDAVIKEGFPVHEIEYSDTKQGDLLYFPGHVGMYIGNQKYIHSTGKEGSSSVVINSLNSADSDYRADLRETLYAVGSVF